MSTKKNNKRDKIKLKKIWLKKLFKLKEMMTIPSVLPLLKKTKNKSSLKNVLMLELMTKFHVLLMLDSVSHVVLNMLDSIS